MSDIKADGDQSIRFFKRLTKLILSGKKTATIRDKSESHYLAGQVLQVYTNRSKYMIIQREFNVL